MHRLLQELHRDHVNLNKVLLLLEKQVDLLAEGQADFYVLSEIVDYVQVYPDLIHHPREDVIFRIYREKFPAALPAIDRLLEEHQSLISSTVELSTLMEQWGCDCPVPRDHLRKLFGDYLTLQFDHLNLEEGSVYGILAQDLSKEDWARVEEEMPQGADPLFGGLMRQRYEHIFDQVMAYAA